MVEQLLDQIKRQEDTRAALSALRAQLKEDGQLLRVKKLLGNGMALEPLLDSPDAKVRKNTAALLGDLGIRESAGALYRAYRNEETLFVRPVLVQALGKTDAYPYLAELKEQYDLLCGRSVQEEQKKHVREEIRVLGQILRREGKEVRHTFTGWDRKHTILLTTNPDFADLTKERLTAERTGIHALGVQAEIGRASGRERVFITV